MDFDFPCSSLQVMSKTRLRAERCRKRCGRNRKLHKWSSISWNPVRVFFRLKSANSRRYETADKSAVVFTEAASVVPANSLYAKTAAKRGGWEAKSDESARAQPLQVGCVSQLDAKVFETSVRTWRTNVKARWAVATKSPNSDSTNAKWSNVTPSVLS